MAEELTWETISGFLGDGTASGNSVNTFRNETSRKMFIRRIRSDLSVTAAALLEQAEFELSKSPAKTVLNTVSTTVFWAITRTLAAGAATDNDVGTVDVDLYAKGQLTLEPNEAIFVNIVKASGGAAIFHYQIGYHF